MPQDDAAFMRRALEIARNGWGKTSPNPMVGALIVRDGEILGEGYHHRCGMPHAEIEALADAKMRGVDPAGATIYVTLEPCSTFGRTPPCTKAIIDARLTRVVIGVLDPNPAHAGRGVRVLEAAGIDVVSGVEEKMCRELNAPFFKWITQKKPFVILKMAMTLDGKIATASGDSKWVTGPDARHRVQQLRQLADAVMVGGETVRLDHPQLLVREPADWDAQPRRLVATMTMSDSLLAELMPGEPAPECCVVGDAEAWERLLGRLGAEQVVTLLLEGGGELAASALNAGVVDYVEFHIAPKILGGKGSRPVVGGSDPARLADALALEDLKILRYGNDIAVSGYCKRGNL